MTDFEGNDIIVTTEEALLERLRTVRRGKHGAFELYHADPYPWLGVLLNGDIAYVHYFPSGDHAGYQPCDMAPDDCAENVRFLQTNATEADSFDMPSDTLVSAEVAYSTAADFFRSADLPPSVSWREL